jgi:hypothetical protein
MKVIRKRLELRKKTVMDERILVVRDISSSAMS